ncbi:MAG: hypothetical protein NWE89_00695 [Candidatus Bathyarchaeota archaeon]|nr:hypothetical protein [Candidatus Bathyarchaeota archaeon]
MPFSTYGDIQPKTPISWEYIEAGGFPYTFPFRFDDKKASRYAETSIYGDLIDKSPSSVKYESMASKSSVSSEYSSVQEKTETSSEYKKSLGFPYTFPFRFSDKLDSKSPASSEYSDVTNKSGLDDDYTTQTRSGFPSSY